MPVKRYAVADSVDPSRVVSLARRFNAIPEPGFRERRTAALAAEALAATGAEVETGIALTGVRASVGPKGAPEILLVADMDGLLTAGAGDGGAAGMAHSCGHGTQMAAMLSAFEALARSGIADAEGLRIVFVGAPAEEYNDMDYRLALRAKGDIRLLSGKQELIRLGVFDDALAALKYHSMPDDGRRIATVNGTLNGFMAKRATFIGKPAHAGAWPELGVNALNAFAIAQLAIHAQRETFRDDDHVRVHPVLKEGGNVVNTVPDKAVAETYVRGASFDAIAGAAAKVDRALAAGAVAVGAKVRIENLPGYLPFRPSPELGALLGKAVEARVDATLVDYADRSYASDDIGDVAAMVPTCQLGFGGFSGTMHGADFKPNDESAAFVTPTLILCDLAEALCVDKGSAARAVRKAFTPRWTREGYVEAVESFFSDRTLSWDPAEA